MSESKSVTDLEKLSDVTDYLYEAINDIHDECFNEYDEEEIIERIRIIAYRAIQKAKGDQG